MKSAGHGRTKYLRFAGIAVAVLMALTSASCGSKKAEISGRLPVFPVAGQLTMGGEPMADAQVFFFAVNELPKDASKIRPHASTDEDGTFRLSTYGLDDGAPAGEYTVTVSWKGPVVSGGDSDDRPEKVPARLRNPRTSRLKVQIKEGKNALVAWDLAGLEQQAANIRR